MDTPAPHLSLCAVPDWCEINEDAPAVGALRDGRLACAECLKDFTICEHCGRDVPKKDAVTVEGEFQHEGYCCQGCER